MNVPGVEHDYLVRTEHIPERARFPVIDAHNHLWAAWESMDRVVEVMNACGVVAYCDLTANAVLEWAEGGYRYTPGRFEDFLRNAHARFPGRFYGFTMATFSRPADEPLFKDAATFVEETIAMLREHVRLGARGLKILKELGLRYRDASGELITFDDARLAPIWDEAARLGIPVLAHQGDPRGFFDPVTPRNEHYDSLRKYPSWSFADRHKFPRREELLARRDRVVERHPNTLFMLPHVANCAEDLGYVSRLMKEYPNVRIDFSARCDELGRRPYAAREFLIEHQDQVYFGTDMPVSEAMYRFYFRFLETRDEYFIPPDYDGTFGRHRWRVHGLGLPDKALEKIYGGNIRKLIPGLD